MVRWQRLGTDNPYLYGGLLLMVAISAYLALSFARTHRELERRLIEVEELSRRNLEQERAAREQELEQRLLAAENERRGRELEEARQLQLSLLPSELPRNKDRGSKLLGYRTLPSTNACLLVGQDEVLVEHWSRRPDGRWLVATFDDPAAVLDLPEIGCRLPIGEIYDGVGLSE